MRTNYKLLLFWLVQRVSIIFLSTLAQGYAEQVQHNADPGLRLEVESQNLQGPNSTIQVTITNTSTAVANRAKYSLVILEKHGKPVRVYHRSIASTIDELTLPGSTYLAELVDIEALNIKETSTTLPLSLEVDKVAGTELILFVQDEKGSIVSNPIFVKWPKKRTWGSVCAPVGWVALGFAGCFVALLILADILKIGEIQY